MTEVTLMKKQPKDQKQKIETLATYSPSLSQASVRQPRHVPLPDVLSMTEEGVKGAGLLLQHNHLQQFS